MFPIILEISKFSYLDDPNAPSVPYFAGFIALWSALFLEHWKRYQNKYSMRWGTKGYEKEEQERIDFVGVQTKSPIDGKPYMQVTSVDRFLKSFRSIFIVFGCVIVVLASLAAIFTIRSLITRNNVQLGGHAIASVISSLAIAFQVTLLNSTYGYFAITLNNKENHRTGNYLSDIIHKTLAF